MNPRDWNGQYDSQRFPSGPVNGIQSDSLPGSASVSACSSLASAGPSRAIAPKFRSLQDLERNVDPGQAESFKRMRLGHRERHRLLSGPRDYFYRSCLLPCVCRAFFWQLWTTLYLLVLWTGLARIVDIFFVHIYLRTEKSFLQDLGNHLTLSVIVKPGILLGALLVAAASTWSYLQLVKMPPPLFATRTAKLLEFMRMLSLNGPAALLGLAIIALRPVYSIDASLSGAEVGSVSIIEVPSVTDFIVWEIILKIILPSLYILACFISAHFMHFWAGDFFIGVIKTEHHGPSLTFAQNPIVLLRHLYTTISSTVLDAVNPVLIYPGKSFWQTIAFLGFLPILFPVADVFRLWIQYQFLAFALLHVWKLNLLRVRAALARLCRIGHLDFVDWISLPSVLSDLRRTGWWWTDYLEMQLCANFVEQLKNQPALLSSFLHMRIPTSEGKQLDEFIGFLLQPIAEFSRYFHGLRFLVELPEEPKSRRLDFLFWTTGHLQCLHDHFCRKSSPNFMDQDFTAYPYAHATLTSVKTMENVRCVSLLAVSAKAVDIRNVLALNYSRILEQVAALSLILENAGKHFEDLTDGRLFQQFPTMEPCIRFYVKSYRQLEHLTRLNLMELVSSLVKDTSELRLKDYPQLLPFIDDFIRHVKER